MTVKPENPRRLGTLDRWMNALRRAFAEDLVVYKVSGTGQAVVTSGRRGDTVYATDGLSCECEAAMLGGDPVCKHRAIFWFNQKFGDESREYDLGVLQEGLRFLVNLPELRWPTSNFGFRRAETAATQHFADQFEHPLAA